MNRFCVSSTRNTEKYRFKIWYDNFIPNARFDSWILPYINLRYSEMKKKRIMCAILLGRAYNLRGNHKARSNKFLDNLNGLILYFCSFKINIWICWTKLTWAHFWHLKFVWHINCSSYMKSIINVYHTPVLSICATWWTKALFYLYNRDENMDIFILFCSFAPNFTGLDMANIIWLQFPLPRTN